MECKVLKEEEASGDAQHPEVSRLKNEVNRLGNEAELNLLSITTFVLLFSRGHVRLLIFRLKTCAGINLGSGIP